MIDLNIGEIGVLIILAVLIFGPDKLPELARKTARVIAMVRNVANNAQDTVRRELGPEFADLNVADLQPKNLAAKMVGHLTAPLQDVVAPVQDVLTQFSEEPGSTIADRVQPAPAEETPAPAPNIEAIFDPEST